MWRKGADPDIPALKEAGSEHASCNSSSAQPTGQLVSREELRKRLWSSRTFVDFEHGLNKAINRLREVLEDSAEFAASIVPNPRPRDRGVHCSFFATAPSPPPHQVQTGWQRTSP
jgi:hypothetical protein